MPLTVKITQIVIDFAFFCGKETQNREIFANSAFRI